jgi:hypothetical protein
MGNFQAECSTASLDHEVERVRPNQPRSVNFAHYTSEKIRGARSCAFSHLDHDELILCLTLWYEACAQAMFQGDSSLINQWVRRLGTVAANRGHDLEEFLELLRLCRSSAIEALVSPVDDVINEALRSGLGDTSWMIPAKLNYVGTDMAKLPSVENAAPMVKETVAKEPTAKQTVANKKPERRTVERAGLKLPIRVFGNGVTGYWLDLILQTENVSRNGLYFLAFEPFSKEMPLEVICPYSRDPKVIRKKLSAKVVRVDRTTDGSRGIAIQLIEPLALYASQELVSSSAR